MLADESLGLSLGLCIPLADSITIVKYSATGGIWKCKFKSCYIICLR